jgi:hypothetical protein
MGCFPVFWRKKNSRSQIVQHDQGKLLISIECCPSEASQNLTIVHPILFADIPPITGNVKIYSSKEMRKATRNFSPGNKLGQGSFGRVYLVGCSSISVVA